MLQPQQEPLQIAHLLPFCLAVFSILATALAANADIIATGDNDLLVLHPYRGIRILNAAETLEVVVHG